MTGGEANPAAGGRSLAYDVHPVAAQFPMMAEDELADLAADISERGLLHPIVRANGQILDGRNRLAACKLAKTEPTFTEYEGEDPAGYALASNIHRRNLTKGQIAMIAAKALRESLNGSQAAMAKSLGVHQTRISQAEVVLTYAIDLSSAVVAGSLGLDAALTEAKQRKQASEGREAQLDRLRADAPDLAAKVVEGELTLAGAQAELKERREQAKRSAVAYKTIIYQPALALAQLFAGEPGPDAVGARIAEFAGTVFEGDDAATLDLAADGLAAVAAAWRKHAPA